MIYDSKHKVDVETQHFSSKLSISFKKYTDTISSITY